MENNRFAAILGDDYALLHYAYPHHDEFQSKVASLLAEHIKISVKNNITVLEGGCGSGVTTSFLLKANPGISIIAVDNEPKMLAQAKELLKEELKRVSLIQSDLLDFLKQQQDRSFDVFVAVWTLHNLPSEYRSRLFPEIYRVLKTGGMFLSGDKYAVTNEEEHKAQLEKQLESFRSFAKMGNSALTEAWVKHNLEDDKIKIKEEEQIEILKKLGFNTIQVDYRKNMEAIITAVR